MNGPRHTRAQRIRSVRHTTPRAVAAIGHGRPSRRAVLGAGWGLTAGLLLAACGASAEATAEVEPEPEVEPEVEPEAEADAVNSGDATAEGRVAIPTETTLGTTGDRPVAPDANVAEPASTPEPVRDPVLVRFTTSHISGPRGRTVRFALDRLAQTEPWLFVEFAAAGPTYDEWLATALEAGTAPHVALGDAAVFQRHRRARLLDITDIVDKLAWHEAAYHFIPDSYTDNGGDMRVPTSRRMHGPVYGLPYAFAIDGWLLNQSQFAGAGVDVPDGGWTWNDVVDIAQKLTDPSVDTWGILAANSPEFFWIPLLYSNGVRRPFLEDRSGTGWLVDGDAASEAFEWAVDLIHESGVAPRPTDLAGLSAETGDPFTSGRLGIFPSGAAHATGYFAPRVAGRFQWGLAKSPVSPSTGVAAHAWQASAHLVTTAAATPDVAEAAVMVASHFTSIDVQNHLAAGRGAAPALINALKTSIAIAPPPDNLIELPESMGDPRTRHLFAFFPTWDKWLRTQAEAAAPAFAGVASPDESLIAMVEAGNHILDAWRESDRGR